MKKYILLSCLLSLAVHAQETRFIYEYEFVPDIHQKDKKKRELMALDTTPGGSSFRSMYAIKTDSLTYAVMNPSGGGTLSLNTGGDTFRRLASMKENNIISYKITKDYPSYTTYFYDMIDHYLYKVKEDEPMKWKISPEKMRIGGYETQKASTDFGGRTWTAWFTPDIPIQDGPYKFHGLPGLIVKIEDGTQTHSMTLIAQNKIPAQDANQVKPAGFRLYSSEVTASKNEFRKAWKDYISNPSKDISTMGTKMINDGKVITDQQDMKRSIEKRVREREEKYNNKIEPGLYEVVSPSGITE